MLRSKELDGTKKKRGQREVGRRRDEAGRTRAHLRRHIERFAEKLSISDPKRRAVKVDEALFVEVTAVAGSVLDEKTRTVRSERGGELFSREKRYLVHIVEPEHFSILGTSVTHTSPGGVDVEMGSWVILDWRREKTKNASAVVANRWR